MRKRIVSAAAAMAVTLACTPLPDASAADAASRDVDALQYTYEITPLLAPFNEYFYVKTDNPHPESFRFSDKDSPYSETSVIYCNDAVYADVDYEDPEMYRVKGGYIFKSFTTNGGEVTLQVHQEITLAEYNTEIYGTPNPETTGFSPYHGMPVDSYRQYTNQWSYYNLGYFKWVDTDIKLTLPELCDDCNYLINTYAGKSDFFDDMTAVQSGFSDICLYSGSFIRGELVRKGERDWYLSPAGHLDQSFYIYSPYTRKDNGSLFASALYPYRYDSLGFPGMMCSVAKRLDPDSTYEWSDMQHAFVNITHNGVTKTYGGAGVGEGQGISEDKLTRRFTFGGKSEAMTLAQSRKLLDEYAAVEMDDDIPRDTELTWKTICDTVGDGSWVNMGGRYAYLYKKDDKDSFSADEWGVGYSIYWSGSLGYASDTWVDGRYVSKAECYVPDAVFADHPEANILLTSVKLPDIVNVDRVWDMEKKAYVYTGAEVAETEFKNVLFRYDATSGTWRPSQKWGSSVYDSYSMIEELVKAGALDKRYLDMITITRAQAEKLALDSNTGTAPQQGYFFDGWSAHGTPFLMGDANDDGKVSVADAVMLQKWLLAGDEMTAWRNADLFADRKLDAYDMVLLRRMLIRN